MNATITKSAFLVLLLSFTFQSCTIWKIGKQLKALKKEFEFYKTAIQEKDLESLINYSHPEIINQLGGQAEVKEKWDQILSKWSDTGALQNMKFTEPSDVVRVDGKSAALIEQVVKVKVPGGFLETTIPILAISENGGKKWSFVNGLNANISNYFPSISESLDIKTVSKPKFVRN